MLIFKLVLYVITQLLYFPIYFPIYYLSNVKQFIDFLAAQTKPNV